MACRPFLVSFQIWKRILVAIFIARIFLLNEFTRNLNTPYLHALYSAFDVFFFQQIILAFVQILLQLRTRASHPLPEVTQALSDFVCLLCVLSKQYYHSKLHFQSCPRTSPIRIPQSMN